MTDDSRIEIERDVKPLLSSGGGDGVGYGSDADPDWTPEAPLPAP